MLSHLLWLMSRSEEDSGNFSAALAYGRRSLDIVDAQADSGKRVSAAITHAELLWRAGRKKEAERLFDDTAAFAQAHCSETTQDFVKEARDRYRTAETTPIRSIAERLRKVFSPKR